MLRIVAGNEQRETKGRGARSEVRSEGSVLGPQKGRFGKPSEGRVWLVIRRGNGQNRKVPNVRVRLSSLRLRRVRFGSVQQPSSSGGFGS